MPLYPDARSRIRANLEALQRGARVSIVAIGKLTQVQLDAINRERTSSGHPPIEPEVVFLGRHIYTSRALRDAYTIEDIVDQVAGGMDAASVVLQSRFMTAMENPNPRPDRYGNSVHDRLILECTARRPRPEVFSVVPKGDVHKPQKKKAAHLS